MKFMIKNKTRIGTLLLMLLMLCSSIILMLPQKAYAISSSGAALYGFNVSDTDFYLSSIKEREEPNIKISKDVLGNSTLYAMRARNKTVEDGYYLDVIMVRVDMNPHYSKRMLASHQGLNEYAQLKFTLNNGKKYINHGPTASPPRSENTWSFGFSAEVSGSEEGASAGIGASLGFSIILGQMYTKFTYA